MAHDFQIGDVVEMKSGGPQMTVKKIGDDGVECVWFDEKKRVQQSDVFDPATLQRPPNPFDIDPTSGPTMAG